MKFVAILVMLVLSGCQMRDHEAEKKDLTRLAECICASKGGYSYLRYKGRTAHVVCHDSDEVYSILLGDICRTKHE